MFEDSEILCARAMYQGSVRFFLLEFITCWCCIELDALVPCPVFALAAFICTRGSPAYRYFRLPRAATVLLRGELTFTRSTHTFGRVSRQPEQLRTAREMCDPCAEVARDTCLNKKGTFPFHRFWVAGLIGSVCLDPG